VKEFLLDNYFFLTHTIEAISALTGLLVFFSYKNSTSKYFIYFLVYLTLCDFVTGYTKLVDPDKMLSFLLGSLIEKNYWFSTLYWKIGAIVFFSFYYQKILKTKVYKNIIKYSGYSFFVFSIIYILLNWQAFFVSFFPIISVLGAAIVFLCTVLYFVEILQTNKLLTFYKSLDFYISAAIFIWWLIITPIVFYDNYTTYQVGVYERDWNYIHLKRLIYLSANIFMYSTFTFALIYCRPKIK
tara:strand:+ start:20135 stop:20857 length:723 start_codon:yes stop_codon:yes gene_type:complete